MKIKNLTILAKFDPGKLKFDIIQLEISQNDQKNAKFGFQTYIWTCFIKNVHFSSDCDVIFWNSQFLRHFQAFLGYFRLKIVNLWLS